MVVMFLLTSGVFCFGADSCSMDGFSGEHCRVGARCGTIKVTAHWRARLTATFQTCSTKKIHFPIPLLEDTHSYTSKRQLRVSPG